MEDAKYYSTRSQEIDLMAQKIKDDFIDETLRLNTKFNRDWTELLNKKGQLTKEQQESDKLNVK